MEQKYLEPNELSQVKDTISECKDSLRKGDRASEEIKEDLPFNAADYIV